VQTQKNHRQEILAAIYPQDIGVSILLSKFSGVESSSSCWTLQQDELIRREVGTYAARNDGANECPHKIGPADKEC
jgi:hypothetical protein